MENKGLFVLAGILLFVFGFIFSVAVMPSKVVDNKTIVEVPKFIYVNNTVEVASSNKSEMDLALATFLKSVKDEKDEAGNEINVLGNYNFDEMSVRKVYDSYNVTFDDEITTVSFDLKLRFKEKDEASITNKYNVVVKFEDGEDTTVNATLI